MMRWQVTEVILVVVIDPIVAYVIAIVLLATATNVVVLAAPGAVPAGNVRPKDGVLEVDHFLFILSLSKLLWIYRAPLVGVIEKGWERWEG